MLGRGSRLCRRGTRSAPLLVAQFIWAAAGMSVRHWLWARRQAEVVVPSSLDAGMPTESHHC